MEETAISKIYVTVIKEAVTFLSDNIPKALCAAFIVFIIAMFFRRDMKRKSAVFFLIFYVALVLLRTLQGRNWPDPLNAVWNGWGLYSIKGELTFEGPLNVIMFIPFGALLSIVHKWKLRNTAYISFLFSAFIEVSQVLFQRGTFQISDLVYNTLGGLLGGMSVMLITNLKMTEKSLDDTETAFCAIYLSFCVVKDERPSPKCVEHIDLSKLFKLCEDHSIAALVSEGLNRVQKSGAGLGPELLEPFKSARHQSMIRNTTMDMERSDLFQFMESRGIRYVPLKGIRMENMYPGLGLREMCDNDILFDPKYRMEIREWFSGRNYEIFHVDSGTKDHFVKPPYASFEMHTSLFHPWDAKELIQYSDTTWDKMVKDSNHDFGYHQTAEDFYLFMIAHAYKHYSVMGIGLRYLLDIYVFLSKCTLNRSYVDSELAKMKLQEFESQSRQLAIQMAGIETAEMLEELLDKEDSMASYILSSGTYGSTENLISNKIKEKGPFGYVLWRIFPPKERLEYYPQIARSKMPLPVKWIWRAGIILGKEPGKIGKELRELFGLGMRRCRQWLSGR